MTPEEYKKVKIQGEIVGDVLDERDRQDAKWGTEFPDRDWDRWVTILTEEVGEFAEAVLEMPYVENGEERVREELIQVAAVAMSALEFGAPQGSQKGAGGK